MPRRRRLRKVVAPPGFKGYRPHGCKKTSKASIELLYEEYEAIKLADYDIMNHDAASKLMGVSRATFARIYESARRKIAQALVEIRPIETVYGNAHLEGYWLLCNNCNARFTMPEELAPKICPMCKSGEQLSVINEQ